MRKIMTASMIVALALGGCHGVSSDTGDGGHRGRYSGAGLYGADHAWRHMEGAPRPADKAVATTADDTTVIVTVDGVTGELRQCGNYSGHCIAMNPWRAGKRDVPVSLSERDEGGVNNIATAVEPDDNRAAPAGK